LKQIAEVLEKNRNVLPSKDHMRETINGGIQKELKRQQNKSSKPA
jgi:hypothetical protein